MVSKVLQGAQQRADIGTRQAALGELDQNMFTKDTDLMYTLRWKTTSSTTSGVRSSTI